MVDWRVIFFRCYFFKWFHHQLQCYHNCFQSIRQISSEKHSCGWHTRNVRLPSFAFYLFFKRFRYKQTRCTYSLSVTFNSLHFFFKERVILKKNSNNTWQWLRHLIEMKNDKFTFKKMSWCKCNQSHVILSWHRFITLCT